MLLKIPILVVGTKSDLVAQIRSNNQQRSSFIAEECGADEIFLVNIYLHFNFKSQHFIKVH